MPMAEPSSWRATDNAPPIIAQLACPESDIAARIPGVTCAAVACCTGSLLHADSKSAAHPTQKAARILFIPLSNTVRKTCS